MIVSVDAGYGFTKAAAQDGRRFCFPSIVMPAAGSGELTGIAGSAVPRHRVDVQRMDCEMHSWLVGDAALAAGGTRTWDMEASRREGYDTLVLAALALLGARDRTDLVVGLPLTVWLQKAERRALRDRLLGLGAWVGVDGAEARYVEIASCQVYPQAVGVYFAALAADMRLAGEYVGVVDIGYRTTDYVLFAPAQEGVSAPDELRSGTFDVGVGQAEEAVLRTLEREAGDFVAPSVVLRALRDNRSVSLLGGERDLRPDYEAGCRQVAGAVEAHIRRAWADHLKVLRAVLLAGGGGAALLPYLSLPAAHPVRDALYANADGFLRLAGSVTTTIQ